MPSATVVRKKIPKGQQAGARLRARKKKKINQAVGRTRKYRQGARSR